MSPRCFHQSELLVQDPLIGTFTTLCPAWSFSKTKSFVTSGAVGVVSVPRTLPAWPVKASVARTATISSRCDLNMAEITVLKGSGGVNGRRRTKNAAVSRTFYFSRKSAFDFHSCHFFYSFLSFSLIHIRSFLSFFSPQSLFLSASMRQWTSSYEL